jgi:hypothetical protein
MRSRRLPALLSLALLPLASMTLLEPPAASGEGGGDQGAAVSTLLDWQLIAIDSIFVDGRIVLPPLPNPNPAPAPVPIPIGALFNGFTSLAVHDAAQRAEHRGRRASAAAIATAAHDVLVHYVPNTGATVDAALATTLAGLRESRAKTAGIRIGHSAAADLIASRAHDGFGDPRYTYSKDSTVPGVFQPVVSPPGPAGGMLAPWLGYVDPLVLRHPVAVDGPPSLRSAEYARDFKEVKATGSLTGTNAHRQEVAAFFYVNSVVATERALVTYLRSHPMSLERTARMFAVMNASMADAIRNIWKLKREIGFWRPSEAIPRAAEDGNDATIADPAWKPFRATPPYSDYASGHAAVIGTIAETARMYLGDRVPLHLISVPVAPPGVTPADRQYATLSALEHDAFLARIWAGIHFRDAMDDGYYIAHQTAQRVQRSPRLRPHLLEGWMALTPSR